MTDTTIRPDAALPVPERVPGPPTPARNGVHSLWPRRGTAERAAVTAGVASIALQPLLHPTGPGNSSPVDLTLLLTILATAVWAAGVSVRLHAPYGLAMSLMVIGGAIAGIHGPLPGTSLLAVIQDVVLFAWTVCMTNLARRPGVLRLFTTTWALTALVWAAVLDAASVFGLTAVEGIVAREGARALFTFGDPNYAATFWVSSVFLVHATQRPRPAWARWAGYLLLVWALVLTGSNGGVVELLVGCAVVTTIAVARRWGAMAVLVLLLVLGATGAAGVAVLPQVQVWAAQSEQPLLMNSLGRSNASSAQRSMLLAEGLQLYEQDGPLGTGPGTTKQLLADRQYAYAKEAHDDYFAALVERGILGVVGIVVLVAGALVRASRVLRAPPQGADVPRPAGLLAALAAMALAGTFYEVLHFRYVWLLLGFIAAVAVRPRPRWLVPGQRGIPGEAL